VGENLEDTIEEHSKYRSPEAKGSIIFLIELFLKIEFTESFCYTRGFHDCLDDSKILFKYGGSKKALT
jgi:hypothetical protein